MLALSAFAGVAFSNTQPDRRSQVCFRSSIPCLHLPLSTLRLTGRPVQSHDSESVVNGSFFNREDLHLQLSNSMSIISFMFRILSL